MNKKPRLNAPVAMLILLALAAAVYANSLPNAFVSDDIPAIAASDDIGQWSAVSREPLFPLRPLLYLIVYRVFGLRPAPFRALNILFHCGGVLVLYLLVRRLQGSRAAFWAGAITAVHPLGTEAVSWISGGPYAQSAFFLLLSLLLLDISRESGTYYPWSLAAFVAGLISSDKAIFFPLGAGLFVLYFQGRRWRKILPFFLLGAIWAGFLLARIGERRESLAAEHYLESTFINPLYQVPVATSSYLELATWPIRLTLYHSEMVFTPGEILLRWIVFSGLAVFAVFLCRRRRPEGFWLVFFFLSLLPTLTPLGISWVVAERYVYLGLAALAAAAAGLFDFSAGGRRIRDASGVLGCLVLALLAARTVRRNLDWRTEDSLWLAAARFSPSSSANHNNLGDLYSRRGEWAKAAASFRRAIELQPGYADAYHNLAGVYRRTGFNELAEENYLRAIHYNPRLWQSRLNLADLLFRRGEIPAALEQLLAAAAINPREPSIRHNLGAVYRELGEPGEAARQFAIADQLRRSPE